MKSPWSIATGMVAALVLMPTLAAAQATSTSGSSPTIPGTAVVVVSPVEADTLPILCYDQQHPEAGFVTEVSDAEWTPRLALTLSRSEDAPEQAAVVLELDGVRYATSFPAGESGEGYYTAMAEVASDTGSRRMISFTSSCLERLVRGE